MEPSFVTGRKRRDALLTLCIIRVLQSLFRVSLYELSPRLQPLGISNRLTARGSGIRDFGHKGECL